MADDPHQKALQLELKKRFLEAGELWESIGQIEKAVVNYHRGGNAKRAIDLALKKGLNKRAAELYAKGEMFDRAAELYRKERDYSNAARAYRQAGLLNEAAAMFETAEEFTEAARVHESTNDFVKAGELYERGGDLVNSARVYEIAIDQKKLDALGGKKDMARVAAVLTKVRSFEKAAEIFVQAQEVAEAVLLFVRMGEVEGAAKLLANCASDVGFEVLSRIDMTDVKTSLEFARMFYLARDYGKAARIFADCREFSKAAYLYEKNQAYHQAAEMFVEAQEPLKAAEMFEKAGSYKDASEYFLRVGEGLHAAQCFEALGDSFAAGRLYYQAEKWDKAIEALQRVEETDGHYLEAAGMAAQVLGRKGYADLALGRYRQLLEGRKCDALSVDYVYAWACLAAEKEDMAEAERLFSEILSFQFGYRDVAPRLEEVRHRKSATVKVEPPVAARNAPPVIARPAVDRAPAAPVSAVAAESLVARMDGFDILSATPLFSDLSLAEMKRFWEVCTTRRVKAGEVVLEEGRDGDGLYVVRHGAFRVVKGGEVLVELHSGEFFGEMSLIEQSAHTSASIAAAGDGELFFLGRDAFNRILAANDGTALKMYRVFVGTLCGRVRQVSEDLARCKAQAGTALEAPDA